VSLGDWGGGVVTSAGKEHSVVVIKVQTVQGSDVYL
jgi:hypothetical protein